MELHYGFPPDEEFCGTTILSRGPNPGPEEMNVVDMLSEHEAVGRNLDKAQLTAANVGAWSRELAVERAPLVGERDPGGEPDR